MEAKFSLPNDYSYATNCIALNTTSQTIVFQFLTTSNKKRKACTGKGKNKHSRLS